MVKYKQFQPGVLTDFYRFRKLEYTILFPPRVSLQSTMDESRYYSYQLTVEVNRRA